jgi:hypothetical protein
MREVTYHKERTGANGSPEAIPGPNVLYRVDAHPHYGQPGEAPASAPWKYDVYRRANGMWEKLPPVTFHRGAFRETTVTGAERDVAPGGVTNEVLLAVLIDRMENYLHQRPGGAAVVPCEQSERALGLLREAMAMCQARTADRLARGVEGRRVP